MDDVISLARRALAMAEKTTPGPWTSGDGRHKGFGVRTNYEGCDHEVVADTDDLEVGLNDANFIAFAREALPALARALIASQEEAEKLRASASSPAGGRAARRTKRRSRRRSSR